MRLQAPLRGRGIAYGLDKLDLTKIPSLPPGAERSVGGARHERWGCSPQNRKPDDLAGNLEYIRQTIMSALDSPHLTLALSAPKEQRGNFSAISLDNGYRRLPLPFEALEQF